MERPTSSQKAAIMANVERALSFMPVANTSNRQHSPSRALNTDDSDSDSTPKASDIPLPPPVVKNSTAGNMAYKDLVCAVDSMLMGC
jgi:hypothetical protein